MPAALWVRIGADASHVLHKRRQNVSTTRMIWRQRAEEVDMREHSPAIAAFPELTRRPLCFQVPQMPQQPVLRVEQTRC